MAEKANNFINKVKYFIGLDDLEEDNIVQEKENDITNLESTYIKGSNKIVNIHTNSNMKLVIYEPQGYEEAPKIVDELKNRRTVVINLDKLEGENKKEVFNFLNGSVYALEGNIQKVSRDIFVLAPSNVEIDGKIAEELRNKSLFPWQK